MLLCILLCSVLWMIIKWRRGYRAVSLRQFFCARTPVGRPDAWFSPLRPAAIQRNKLLFTCACRFADGESVIRQLLSEDASTHTLSGCAGANIRIAPGRPAVHHQGTVAQSAPLPQ